MENKEVKLILGLNDKDSKKQEIATNKAINILQSILLQYTDGYTLQVDATGFYTHEDGEVVQEESFIIILYFTSDEVIAKIIKELKQAFNQESVMKVVTPCEVSFE